MERRWCRNNVYNEHIACGRKACLGMGGAGRARKKTPTMAMARKMKIEWRPGRLERGADGNSRLHEMSVPTLFVSIASTAQTLRQRRALDWAPTQRQSPRIGEVNGGWDGMRSIWVDAWMHCMRAMPLIGREGRREVGFVQSHCVHRTGM